jgi:Flp pilus assembly protein TadD
MGVLAPVKGTEDAFVVLRPMPRLFEPRASEAEELMQQLFAGTAEIRAESSNTDDADWVTQPGTGLEMTDPNGGWTTAPMPQMLAEGLSPELARQLDAFQTPMRVEAPAIAPEVVAAQKFADREPQLSADTVMETALMNAADDSESVAALEAQLNESLAPDALDELAAAHLAQARGRQARIETPWMTPVVHVPVEQTVTASVSTVEVIASMYEPVTDRTVTPILTPAVAAVGMPAQLRIQTPVLTKAVDPAQAFFESEEPSAMLSLENPMPARTTRRVWPFAVVALAIVALALGFEMLREPAPVVEAPRPTVVVAPVLPDIEPPEFIETDEPVALIDVNENLDEARKLYEAGQYKKALSVLEQVVSDEPKSVLAWNLIGLARYDSLDPVGARAAADKVLELDPKNGRVQILLATMYFDANDKVNGRAALEKYLELEPNGASVDEAKALLKRY